MRPPLTKNATGLQPLPRLRPAGMQDPGRKQPDRAWCGWAAGLGPPGDNQLQPARPHRQRRREAPVGGIAARRRRAGPPLLSVRVLPN